MRITYRNLLNTALDLKNAGVRKINMKIVKEEDLLEFVMRQPDNRRVNMDNNVSDDACGCVMVDYGREVLKLEKFGCGFSAWEVLGRTEILAKIETGESIFGLLKLPLGCNVTTYGEIKQKMRNDHVAKSLV